MVVHMIIRRIIWLVYMAAVLPVMVWADGQSNIYKEREKYLANLYENELAKNFSGWKGIIFLCSYDSNDEILAQICQRGTTDLKLLAAGNKVNLAVAKPNDYRGATVIATLDQFLTLEYELIATVPEDRHQPKLINARLVFRIYYSNAIEKDARSNSMKRFPRAGDLELWSRVTIGSGMPSNIVVPFSSNAEMIFKEALTLFLKYQQ